MKLKKGDTVRVISGKDKGKTGTVVRVLPREGRVLVDGVNRVKRHTKARGGQSSRIVEAERPIDLSNVMLVDPKTKKPTRVGRVIADGALVRVAKKSGTTLS
ncbi:MAG: 50S ribosomal protein L24 [Patescibacteria group bacterium]|nr:50S ribosomal protein L24 [Patescibacteria group bacterium]MDE1966386.1 50S ribosomal protein L24 [Patescibacteria group bacterium]